MTRADGLQGFVQQLNGWHRIASMLSIVLQHALVAGIAVISIDFLNPAYFIGALWIAVIWLLVVSLSTYLTARVRPERVDEELGLHDGLTTWLEVDPDRVGRPMVEWLERDLDERLGQVPIPTIRWMGLRRLGLLRYLIPLLVVLFLLRLIGDLVPPLPAGPVMLTGQAGGVGEAGGSGGAELGPGESQTGPGESEPEDPDPEKEQESPPPGGDSSEEEEPEGPEDSLGKEHDLLDLKTEDSFAIPQFIGEGPSTREEALVAKEVVSKTDAPEPEAQPKRGDDKAEPEREQTEFKRAQERALRSRHIPDEERAIVRAYFRLLLEGRR